MTLIVCVDDELGMASCGKRQSRDRALCEDIVAFAEGKTIRMDPRSAKLFEGLGGNIETGGALSDCTEAGTCCFAEFEPVRQLAERAHTLVIYRWNRHYPSDLRFDVPLEEWRLHAVTEFAGTSHEIITREVYIHEN